MSGKRKQETINLIIARCCLRFYLDDKEQKGLAHSFLFAGMLSRQ